MTCPNQITRPISPGRVATFGVACRSCPLAERCTTSKTGRKIVLHEHGDQLRSGRRLELRYRGTLKNNAWLKHRTAALNLHNLIGRGLDQVNGIWIVATT